MNKGEARKILGLSPKDDPRDHMEDFKKNLRSKKDLVEIAADEESRQRCQQDLHEYAIAISILTKKKKLNSVFLFLICVLLIGAIATPIWWAYDRQQQQLALEKKNQQRLEQLSLAGHNAVNNRKWNEAEQAFQKMLLIDENSKGAKDGLESIKQAKLEERKQQLVFTLGQSQAALETSRWEDAKQHAMTALEIDPNNNKAKHQLELIIEGKQKQLIAAKVKEIDRAINNSDLTVAQANLAELRKIDPQHKSLVYFNARIDAALAEIQAKQVRSEQLFQAAKRLDTGEFIPEAVTMLAEAKKLDPTNTAIAALHTKMSSYTRLLNVPTDFPTISEALETARPKDIIHVAAGTYKEALDIRHTVRLRGEGGGKTIIQLPAEESALITIHPTSKETLISGFALAHEGFDHEKERFSGITVMAPDVHITGCSITQAAGHGIAVIDGGTATISGCGISNSGWDGIAVYGEASRALIRNTKSNSNIQHGVGVWNGGSVFIGSSEMQKNGFCGIFVTGEAAQASIDRNRCSHNREAGILISDGVNAVITANRCDKNLLSGIVVRSQGTKAEIADNITTGNQEAGILTHADVEVLKFDNNKASGNAKKQILRDVTLKK